MTFKTTLTAAVLASGLVFGTSPAALAQAQPDGIALVQEDGKLESFVMAAFAVDEVRNIYVAQLQTLEDETAQQALIKEADIAIVQAIEDAEGITLEEYVAIGEAAATNPEIAAKLDTMMQENAPME